jgi:hypothetical protein
MAIMPLNIGPEQPACGCGGCTCGATEINPTIKEDSKAN